MLPARGPAAWRAAGPPAAPDYSAARCRAGRGALPAHNPPGLGARRASRGGSPNTSQTAAPGGDSVELETRRFRRGSACRPCAPNAARGAQKDATRRARGAQPNDGRSPPVRGRPASGPRWGSKTGGPRGPRRMGQRGTRPSLAQRRDLRADPRRGSEPAADRAGPAGPAGPGGMRRRGGGGGEGALSLLQRPCTLAAGLRRRLAPSGGETRFLQAIYSFSSSVSFITQKALHARCGLTAHACPVRRGRQAGSPPLNQSIRGSDAEALLAQGGTGRALEPAIRPSPSMIQSPIESWKDAD